MTVEWMYFKKSFFSGLASAMCKGGDAGARLSVALAKLRPTVQGALERSDPEGDAQSNKMKYTPV